MLLHNFSSWMCFAKTALESLSKTLMAVSLLQIDLLDLVAKEVMVQPALYFV